MTSWASVMEHMTFGLALCKWKTIARKNCTRNAGIPALGYGAVQEKVKSQEALYIQSMRFGSSSCRQALSSFYSLASVA